MIGPTIAIKIENSSERIYALDALRGIMMLLGIVIHTSLTYGTTDYAEAWPLKDKNATNIVFDLLAALIHVFRMPVFMVAAGYLGALLFYKKGSMPMMLNRTKRILVPFVVAVLLIFPMVVFSFVYSNASISESSDAMHQAMFVITSGKFLPFRTSHLWFLYYLFLFSLTAWLLANIFRKSTSLTITLNSQYKKIIRNFWLRLFCTGSLFFVGLYWMGTEYLQTNNTFDIIPSIFMTYFLFYGIGWLLYSSDSLKELTKYPEIQLGIATGIFMGTALFRWPDGEWVLTLKQALAAIYTPLFIFGFIALFLKYFNSYTRRMNYLMEAAYWVYIIHLPIVVFIPGLIAGFELPSLFKFGIVLLSTTMISFISYHCMVRSTFIGMFLNGKVHR